MLRPRRSPRLIVIGVLVACLGALGGAVAFTQTTHAQPVVVMVADVARGEVVERGDLGVAEVGVPPGVESFSADRISELVGRHALVDLPAGVLVGSTSIGTPVAEEGMSQLGLKLGAGRLPTSPLPAGTTVLLVPVPTKDDGGSAGPMPNEGIPATVVSQPTVLPDGATWVVDVAVADEQAVRVAQLAAGDALVVVRQER
ncbi:SAF domain-containing protein [Aestuariimicrobium kwangyangense]|uniref:SAF domain-containing protein n=1 Tax=Aestuariimicrobium kwangyangense TaxID=396389 RepID=UPI0003B2F62C|nr:SAF domain-containing protein [Aestuariimicrobium kwangyangense]